MAGRRVPQKCAFCEDYQSALGMQKHYKEEFNYNIHLRVRLYERGMKNRVRKYDRNHHPRELRFCPSCGKKLAK